MSVRFGIVQNAEDETQMIWQLKGKMGWSAGAPLLPDPAHEPERGWPTRSGFTWSSAGEVRAAFLLATRCG
jgi:hypothetical protein